MRASSVLLTLGALLGELLAGCKDSAKTPVPVPVPVPVPKMEKVFTPEDVIATATIGAGLTVSGTVFALTFDSIRHAADDFEPLPDRWILIRTKRPPGVT